MPKGTYEPAIGIDLGTTNSAVAAVAGDGKPYIIERRTGQRLLPSMVGFAPTGDRVVGEAARALAEEFPENVAYATKRLMGQRWSPELAAQMRNVLPFPIVAGPADDVRVKIAGRALPVVQVAAMILTELRMDAEAYFQQPVKKAVLTVPANFNDAQRQATQEAARIAGLEPLRLLNEPTAAALAYGLTTGFEGRAIVLDLGGGTFDVSLLEVSQGVFEVVGTGGHPFLGGEDFDQRVARWLLEHIEDESVRERVLADRVAVQRLKVAAEQAKCAVSLLEATPVSVDLLPESRGNPCHIETTLTRVQLEELVEPLVQRCIEIVNRTLTETNVDAASVEAVLLVGGMTRMPLVRTRLTDRFGRPPATGVSPDEAVALGAAVHAHEISSRQGQVVLLDIVGSTLGVGITGGACKHLIRKRTQLPCECTEIFHPSRDGQTLVRIPVFQGESLRSGDNFLLGELVLDGLRTGYRGETKIAVTFAMGTDGVLSVSARDVATGQEQTARIAARTDLQASEAAHIAAEEQEHLTTADRIEQEVRQRNVEAHGALHDVITRLETLHKDLTIAAAESPLANAQTVVEALGKRLVDANHVATEGTLEQVVATARDLEQLERSLLAG
ncbi:MAG: Hsp70 family protein [Myxococcales bacterium]